MGITSHADNKKVIVKLERLDNEIFYELEQDYHDIGELLTSDLKKGLKRVSRSGIKYAVKRFRASAKGEYPQRVTGLLRKSIKHKVFSYKEMWFGSTEDVVVEGVSKKVKYAGYLENKGRLLLTHTVNKLDKETKNILEKRLNNAIKRD